MRSTTGPAAVAAPWVWTAGEITARGEWIVTLGAAARDEMAAALDRVKRRGLALKDITASDFPLPSMAPAFATIGRLLGEGPGLCLVRGIPVERYARDDLALILWGVGTHIGRGVAQSYRGDMIGDVMDMSHTGDTRRSYRSPRALALHCDPVDVVGLLCLRRAKTGGTSLLASSLAVHNAILAERPDLLPALYRGYHGAPHPGLRRLRRPPGLQFQRRAHRPLARRGRPGGRRPGARSLRTLQGDGPARGPGL
jgi:hypothetical protein